jgi:3-hydroxyacyl-[acyl-carrier-protein] dehydratase
MLRMTQPVLDRDGIEAVIPHREPFLFIDRIVEIEYGRRAVGYIDDIAALEANVLRGHFPGFPVMPGVIIVEALAQVGGVAALGLPANRDKIAMLTGLDKWKFRTPARPGDQVRLETELLRVRANFGRGHGRATIGEQLVAEGEISFAIVDRPAELGR